MPIQTWTDAIINHNGVEPFDPQTLKGLLVTVTATNGTHTADKTAGEIWNAFHNGNGVVFAIMEDEAISLYPLTAALFGESGYSFAFGVVSMTLTSATEGGYPAYTEPSE